MADQSVPSLGCEQVAELAPGFVLGALEPAETAAVRAHLATCARPHPELAELGGVVPSLARSLDPVAPPAGLGPRILAAARSEARASGAAAAATPGQGLVATGRRASAPTAPGESVAPARTRGLIDLFRHPGWAFATAAAVVAVVILGAWNLDLRARVDQAAAYDRALEAALASGSGAGGQLAILRGQGGNAASGVAGLTSSGQVVLAVRDLAPTSGGHVYEAWVIGSAGTPAPIGSFEVGSAGTGVLSTTASVAPGVVVALTLEPGPGATTPTLPILATGQAGAGTG